MDSFVLFCLANAPSKTVLAARKTPQHQLYDYMTFRCRTKLLTPSSCASFSARLTAFLCSRFSAFARCFSCRFSSFWRFRKVIAVGLLGKLALFCLQ